MARTKRPVKSDSAQAAVNAMLNAAQPTINPPAHVRVRPDDRPFWEGIINSRARDEWSEADLVVAAQLARCQKDIETESVMLEQEGAVIENARGTPVANPRALIIEQLARREMALMRSLRMGGKIAGDPRDSQAQRKIERQARLAREDVELDDLLAL